MDTPDPVTALRSSPRVETVDTDELVADCWLETATPINVDEGPAFLDVQKAQDSRRVFRPTGRYADHQPRDNDCKQDDASRQVASHEPGKS